MFIHVGFEGLNIWGKGQIVACSPQNSTKKMRTICRCWFGARRFGCAPSLSKRKNTWLGCQASQPCKLGRFGLSGNVKPLSPCNLWSWLGRTSVVGKSMSSAFTRRRRHKERKSKGWKLWISRVCSERNWKKTDEVRGMCSGRWKRAEQTERGRVGEGRRHVDRSWADPWDPLLGPILASERIWEDIHVTLSDRVVNIWAVWCLLYDLYHQTPGNDSFRARIFQWCNSMNDLELFMEQIRWWRQRKDE